MSSARRAEGAVVVLACCVAMGGACGTYRPPFTQASSAGTPADPQQATVVFLWPVSSCDPGGYYTLATTEGHFVGNVSEGTQLRVVMPAGEHTFVGWDELQEQAAGVVAKGTVPVIRARLSAGRTYYVRMAFGEWDNWGPREVYSRSGLHHGCFAPGMSMTSAMVAVTPTSGAWSQLPEWTQRLEAVVPDVVKGQAWLDRRRDVLDYHRTVGQARYEGLRPEAKRMATVEETDGVSSSADTPPAAADPICTTGTHPEAGRGCVPDAASAQSALSDAPAASAVPVGRGLSPEQIRRVVLTHKGALQACYELEARTDPTLRGGVTVTWKVDASGAVTDADLPESTIHDARVEGCVLRQVRSWQFPSSETGAVVRFPFSFGIGSGP